MCQSLFSNKVAGLRPATLLKKETLAQVFSSEFWEISKGTFLTEHLWVTASVPTNLPIKAITAQKMKFSLKDFFSKGFLQ